MPSGHNVSVFGAFIGAAGASGVFPGTQNALIFGLTLAVSVVGVVLFLSFWLLYRTTALDEGADMIARGLPVPGITPSPTTVLSKLAISCCFASYAFLSSSS